MSIMGEIYRKAERVNDWLAPGTEASGAVVAELKSLFKVALLARGPAHFLSGVKIACSAK